MLTQNITTFGIANVVLFFWDLLHAEAKEGKK